MNKLIFYLLSSLITQNSFSNDSKNLHDTVNLIEVSQQLLLAAKLHDPTDSQVSLLANADVADLHRQLSTDDKKKVFWINLYNAYTQIILSKNPQKYKNRNDFFSNKQVIVAGKKISMDDIEHGILRRSKIKWSFGYFDKIFYSAFEKLNRVERLDYRIHFALNCGAKSCPPIAFYTTDKIDDQLDIAMKAYINTETNYHAANNIIYLPEIMSWFRGDFGGQKGIKKMLRKLSIIPANKNPSIRFKKYDWNLFLANYKSEQP